MTISIQNKNSQAIINHKGAELVSLKQGTTEYIWEGNPVFWGKHAPVLFPIVGTLKNNSYEHEQVNYQLPRHGFARDMEFEVINKTQNSVTFLLEDTTETLKIYPFLFKLEIEYVLKINTLSITYKVTNKQQDAMYFSLGGHPAFSLTNPFQEYALLFSEDQKIECFLLEDGLLTPNSKTIALVENKLNLHYKLFEKDALVIKKLQSKSIILKNKTRNLLRFNFHDFPNLGIWTVPNAPFICLEPWLGYSDTLNCTGKLSEKEGIVNLKGQSTMKAGFEIEILDPSDLYQ